MKTMVGRKRKINGRTVFYVCMAAWPVIQFVIFYLCVNFNSILLAFKKFEYGKGYSFAGMDNFTQVIKDLRDLPYMKIAIKNTFQIFGIGIIVMFIPMILSYYLYKKYPLSGVFKVMLFLPSIVPSMALTICFRNFADLGIPELWKELFGKKLPPLLYTLETQWETVLVYNIFFSIGANFLLYTGAMSGISESVIEAAQLDGVKPIQEFTKIVFPMIFPTFSTFLVTSFAGLFTNQANIFSFFATEAEYQSYTLGYYLYREALGDGAIGRYPYLSALGLLCTCVAIPLCFGTKYLLNKFGPKVD